MVLWKKAWSSSGGKGWPFQRLLPFAACSPGFCGKHCQRRSSPCLSTHTYNPLTGRCDGSLSCVRRFSPSCLHGKVCSFVLWLHSLKVHKQPRPSCLGPKYLLGHRTAKLLTQLIFLLGLVHSRCPRGPGWWFWGGHCYYVEEQGGKSWQEAKAACQAYGENVTLLVLSSAKEKARTFGCLFNGVGWGGGRWPGKAEFPLCLAVKQTEVLSQHC